MNAKRMFRSGLVAASLMAVALGANAQATRTWVSGVGDDVNPCSRTAPCKTFAGAISKTASGGIIDALDPGGYGAVTITKPITIEGNGTLASALASGTNGIIVNITSGTNRNVVLRNITIDGSGTTIGLNGIRFLAGDSLLVEHCSIEQFSGSGIDFEPNSNAKLMVRDTTVTQMTTNGILIKATSPATAIRATISNSSISFNGIGVRAEDLSNILVEGSEVSNNATGIFSFAAGGIGTVVIIDRSQISTNSTVGLKTQGGGSILQVGNSVISGNATGLDHSLGGQLSSFGNNIFSFNTSQGTFTTPAPVLQ